MTHLRIKIVGLVFLLSMLVGTGCDRASAPPAPLPVEEIPTAFEKAFSKAKPEAKDLAKQFVAAVQEKDYSKAFLSLQTLLGKAELTKEQSRVATSALLTVNTLLEAAQAQGDTKATQTIQNYRSTK